MFQFFNVVGKIPDISMFSHIPSSFIGAKIIPIKAIRLTRKALKIAVSQTDAISKPIAKIFIKLMLEK